ncbi:sigma-70 family RNA polymerase sigma factor [Cellulomonas sp.]|uniref:RNA polymerase sigma factor n=1 Tax=Cellulomonas sp. TaxID=40001 RepID=UPI001B2CA741|nr:sigma-70 family RNA polymerase sigma factor [Cellulomonas sp.]MBO9556506.1 sigma-70 family RNA polymerase sigma factor [Cellulomonas sp.]
MSARWEDLLEQVVRERHGRLVGYALLVCGSREDAQDLVQDALVATFSGRARFTTLAQAEAYVRRAIVTRSIDESRRRTRERSAVTRLGARPATPVVVEARGLGADVHAALQGLAPRERACVVLRHVDDLSVRETAAALGLSEGAVKRYTADATARLDAVLGTTTTDRETAAVRLLDHVGGEA